MTGNDLLRRLQELNAEQLDCEVVFAAGGEDETVDSLEFVPGDGAGLDDAIVLEP